MTIPLKANFVDLVNLAIAKSSSFFLTLILFALISRGMDAEHFAEFAYWWSIAIMVGGVLLGGFTSAIVRAAVTHKSLSHLMQLICYMAIGCLCILMALTFSLLITPNCSTIISLFISVSFFGLSVQIQTVLMALLRASEASKVNLVGSILIPLIVPAPFFLASTKHSLTVTFLMLSLSFLLSSAVVYLISHQKIKHLFDKKNQSLGYKQFVTNTISFTLVNIFSYAIVNIDFTLFRALGSSDSFTVMATGKVFFERFLLPFLLVFGGGVSLKLFKHSSEINSAPARIELPANKFILITFVSIPLVVILMYWIYTNIIRIDSHVLSLSLVGCLSIGYLLFAFNGVLFDVFALNAPPTKILQYVLLFILIAFFIQAIAINFYGLVGWGVGWLIFNLTVNLILASRTLVFNKKVPL